MTPLRCAERGPWKACQRGNLGLAIIAGIRAWNIARDLTEKRTSAGTSDALSRLRPGPRG